jgi:uncharacterized RDD family membrane protein YckC
MLAILYDTLLLLALSIMLTLAFIAVNSGESVSVDQNLTYQLCLGAISYVFFVAYWTRSGRTLGMQSWRLQLETSSGERAGIATASIRYFAAILSWAPLGLGFWWQLWDKDRLAWHDRISGTRLMHYPKDS